MAVSSKNAILNVGRLNAFRLNYLEAGLKRTRDQTLTITLDGAPLQVRRGSLQVHDVINDAPNTCTLTVDDATPPTVGGRLKVVLGVDPKYTLFVGTLQAARQSYVGRMHADAWDCEAIDDTARADWRRPFGAWNNVTATQIAIDIINQFAPGFTWEGVQLALPNVTVYLDGTERVNGALRLLAKLIGGYYYFEDYVLHLFQGDEPGANPDDVTGAQLLEDPRLTASSDDSQIRTRCYGKGHSEATLSACLVGETKIPIANAVMFAAGGGKAISEWQRLTYTGVSLGGGGALVGPGVTPSAAPSVAVAAGTGVDAGSHQYAYTWKTAAGETLASPLAAITVAAGLIPRPTVAPTFLGHGGVTGNDNVDPLQSAAWKPGDTVEIGYSHATTNTNTTTFTPMGPTISVVAQQSPYYYHTPGDAAKTIYISLPYSTNAQVKYLILWHRVNGGPWYWWQGPDNHPEYLSPYPWNMSNPAYYSASGATPPGADLTSPQRVQMSGITPGPAGVTQRYLYRSKAGTTAPLWFIGALGDNTSTTFLDTTTDAAASATSPASDTSGLQMPAGQVLPGAAALPVSGTGWALPAGGWTVIGNGQQVIRYSGIAGNTLTGIPAAGPGAITAAVNFNSTVTGAPMLIGVNAVGSTGLAAALIAGAPINIWVQIDDQSAQSALAARVGGSGIIEQLIVDERRGEPSLIALCTADLALYSRPIVTVRYTTFDPKSRSGRPVRVHLTQPAIDQTLVIQDVTIATGTGPARFTVTASSVRYALEDLLRRMVGTLEEGF